VSNYGTVALHIASKSKGPLEVITYLLNVWPESVKVASRDGRVALHYACQDKAPLNVIKHLVSLARVGQLWIDCLALSTHVLGVDPTQNAPLRVTSTYVIKYLVEVWPESVEVAIKDARVALHIVCNHHYALYIFDMTMDETWGCGRR
jgi:hypothetical protein